MSQGTTTTRRWLASQARHGGCWPYVTLLAGSASTLLLFLQAWAIASITHRMVIDNAVFADVTMPLLVLPLAFSARGALAWVKTEAATRSGMKVRQVIRSELLQRIGEHGPLWGIGFGIRSMHCTVTMPITALSGHCASSLLS